MASTTRCAILDHGLQTGDLVEYDPQRQRPHRRARRHLRRHVARWRRHAASALHGAQRLRRRRRPRHGSRRPRRALRRRTRSPPSATRSRSRARTASCPATRSSTRPGHGVNRTVGGLAAAARLLRARRRRAHDQAHRRRATAAVAPARRCASSLPADVLLGNIIHDPGNGVRATSPRSPTARRRARRSSPRRSPSVGIRRVLTSPTTTAQHRLPRPGDRAARRPRVRRGRDGRLPRQRAARRSAGSSTASSYRVARDQRRRDHAAPARRATTSRSASPTAQRRRARDSTSSTEADRAADRRPRRRPDLLRHAPRRHGRRPLHAQARSLDDGPNPIALDTDRPGAGRGASDRLEGVDIDAPELRGLHELRSDAAHRHHGRLVGRRRPVPHGPRRRRRSRTLGADARRRPLVGHTPRARAARVIDVGGNVAELDVNPLVRATVNAGLVQATGDITIAQHVAPVRDVRRRDERHGRLHRGRRGLLRGRRRSTTTRRPSRSRRASSPAATSRSRRSPTPPRHGERQHRRGRRASPWWTRRPRPTSTTARWPRSARARRSTPATSLLVSARTETEAHDVLDADGSGFGASADSGARTKVGLGRRRRRRHRRSTGDRRRTRRCSATASASRRSSRR